MLLLTFQTVLGVLGTAMTLYRIDNGARGFSDFLLFVLALSVLINALSGIK